jgi:hypothetical protein
MRFLGKVIKVVDPLFAASGMASFHIALNFVFAL